MDCGQSANSDLISKFSYADVASSLPSATQIASDSQLTHDEATSHLDVPQQNSNSPTSTKAPDELSIDANFAEDDFEMNESSTNESTHEEKRRFIRHSKKMKRLHRKKQVSQFIKPKNALMALHELLGTAFLKFNILPEEQGFVASVYINDVLYEGRGPSKPASKSNAAEWALRDIMLKRMLELQRSKLCDESSQQAEEKTAEDVKDPGDKKEDEEFNTDPSILHLASFALFKLFSEWQADGFEIPGFKVGSPLENKPNTAIKFPVPPKRTHLPENAQAIHPTRLLCIMRPQTKYIDLGTAGTKPNILYYVGVEVDGAPFIASAKNKKLARKYAAIDACNQSFGTAFNKDEN